MKRIPSLFQICKQYHQSLLGINTQINVNNITPLNRQQQQFPKQFGVDIGSRTFFTTSGPSLFPRRGDNPDNTDIEGVQADSVASESTATATTPRKSKEKINTSSTVVNNKSNSSSTSTSSSQTVNSTASASAPNAQVVEAFSLEDLLARASRSVTAGKIDDAISDLSDAIKMDGNESRAYGLRADLYEHKGRFQDALADYKKVLELIPESVPCLSSMAECYVGLKDYDRAIKQLEQVLIIDPRYVPAIGSLSEVYLKVGDTTKALDYCKRLLEVDSNNIDGFLMLAHVAFKQGSLEHAVKLYKRVIEMGRNMDRDQMMVAKTVSTDGPKLKKSNDFNPIYGASICLATIADIQQDAAKQMEYVDIAIKENPQSSYAVGLKGSIHLRMKQPEIAYPLLKQALDMDPESEMSKMAFADCLFDMNRLDDSIKHYTEVLANMLERDLPEEANTRIMLLHNMLIGYVKQVSDFPELDISCDIDIEPEISKEVNSKPQNLQELSKKSRALVLVLNKILAKQTDQQIQSFVKSNINTLKHIALSSNQSLEIRHNQKVTFSKEAILDPLDDILYYYYEYVRATYFGKLE